MFVRLCAGAHAALDRTTCTKACMSGLQRFAHVGRVCVHARARKCESAAALLAPAHCIEYLGERISPLKRFQDREAEGAEATGGAATGAHGTRGKGIKLSHARTLARTHSHTRKRPCARTRTHIAQTRRQGKRGAARETNAEQHSQHTAACACIRSQDMRMHRARLPRMCPPARRSSCCS